MSDQSWFLLADVGGTNARFAVADAVSGDIAAQYITPPFVSSQRDRRTLPGGSLTSLRNALRNAT